MEGEELSRLRAHRRQHGAPAARPRRITSGCSTATRARTPAAWARTRRSRSPRRQLVDDVIERDRPPDARRACATRGRAVQRAALRRADAHARRAEGRRVQLPLRRSGDAGRAAGLDASRPLFDLMLAVARGEPLADDGRSTLTATPAAVTTVVAAAGIPSAAHRRRHRRCRRRVRTASVFHAGTTRDDAGAPRHRRRTRPRRHRPSADTSTTAQRAQPRRRRTRCSSTGSSSARDIGWRELSAQRGRAECRSS